MPEVLQEYDARANAKGDCIVKVAGVSNADLFRLRAVVSGMDLDTGCTQLYHIVEVVFVDLAVGSVQAEGTVESGDVGQREVRLYTGAQQFPVLYVRPVDPEAV